MSTMIKKWNDDLHRWYPVGSIAVLPSDIIWSRPSSNLHSYLPSQSSINHSKNLNAT